MRYFRHNPLPELFTKTEGLSDDRLLALVTALIVEGRLDATLSSFLPRYARLTDASDFTFSLKIALLESLAFVPPQVCSAADLLRKVRNEFAHNLDISSFDQLKPKLRSEICNLRASVYGVFGSDERKPKDTFLAEFKALAFFCIVGLDAYQENLSYLRTHIETPDFVDALLKKAHEENWAELKSVLEAGPTSVEVRDGQRIERYEKGVVRIESGSAVGLGSV
jgi:hypothetical protein